MYSAKRYSPAHNRALLFVILLGLMLLGLAVSSAQEGTADEATPDQAITATPTAQAVLAPFPTTTGMTETVEAVLRAYEARVLGPQSLGELPVDVAALEQPIAVDAVFYRTYLTFMVKGSVAAPPTPYPAPATATPTATPIPTATPRPAEPADLAVTLWPSPSINVARNGTLQYEIRIKNYGSGRASSADVKLPYNRQLMTVTNSRFSKAGDWVSQLTNEHVIVTFGPVAPGEYRTATIIFKVQGNLVDNTVLNMRASYTWAGSGTWPSNWAPVLVRSGDASAEWVWLSVTPDNGPVGTTHRFFTDRFIPGEGIITWLNTPTGVQPLTLRSIADTQGRVTVDFKSDGLKAGRYSLVLYGARSNLTAVATFIVR